MDGMNKVVVALLVLAIIFSVVSVTLILGLSDLEIGSPLVRSSPVLEGSQAGKVNLYVVSNTGVAP